MLVSLVGALTSCHCVQVQTAATPAYAIQALIANFQATYSPKAKPRKGGWVKPPNDFVEINVDASFDASDLRGTTGVVIRDLRGEFVAACNTSIDHVNDALTTASALKQGLMLCQSLGCNRIMMESDCLEVIDTMKNGAVNHGIAAAIF